MESIAGLHPLVVHFPVAFLLLYTLFEIAGILFKNEMITKGAHLILILGVLCTVAAVITGNQAKEVAEHLAEKGSFIPGDILEMHEEYATITLWYFFAILGLRTYFVVKKKFIGLIKIVFIILSLIGAFLVFKTSGQGGELVYKYGIGTDIIKQSLID